MGISAGEIQDKFKKHLTALNESKTDGEKYITDDKKVSVFTYTKEFEKFLDENYKDAAADASIKTDELLKLKFQDGKFQENKKSKSKFPLIGIINDILTDAKMKYIIDKNGDNEIKTSEIQSFIIKIDQIDGRKGNLSLKDILSAAEELKKLNPADEKKPDGSAGDTFERQENPPVNQPEKAQNNQPAGNPAPQKRNTPAPVQNTQNVSAPASSGRKPVNNADKKPPVKSKTEGGTLEELQKLKAAKEKELEAAQKNYDDVISGVNETVEKALENFKNADENFKKLLNSEKNIKSGFKEKIKKAQKKEEDAAKKETEKTAELHGIENSINQQEHKVSEDKALLSDLEGALSRLRQNKTENPEDKKHRDEEITKLQIKINEAKNKLAADASELAKLKEAKHKAETELEKIKETKQEAQELKQQLEEQYIVQNDEVSKELKDALAARREAEKNLETAKKEEIGKAEKAITALRQEIDGIDGKIKSKKTGSRNYTKDIPAFDIDIEENMTPKQEADLESFKEHFKNNREKYEEVSKKTGLPAELIAAINWRESRGKFDSYLHNGQKLGTATTRTPKNIYFGKDQWAAAAADAVNRKIKSAGLKVDTSSLSSLLDFAERYNGAGYKNRGAVSPYVWAGTTKYESGMFVKDGKYDKNYKDNNIGIAVMLKAAYGLHI